MTPTPSAETPGDNETVTLYRPTGPKELELVRQSGWRAWPPRLPEQPIFYPVLTEEYAIKIARDWNAKDAKTDYTGYVTRFRVRSSYLDRFDVRQVGGREHVEYWIPAEELDEFNAHVVGEIEVIHEFHGEPPERPRGPYAEVRHRAIQSPSTVLGPSQQITDLHSAWFLVAIGLDAGWPLADTPNLVRLAKTPGAWPLYHGLGRDTFIEWLGGLVMAHLQPRRQSDDIDVPDPGVAAARRGRSAALSSDPIAWCREEIGAKAERARSMPALDGDRAFPDGAPDWVVAAQDRLRAAQRRGVRLNEERLGIDFGWFEDRWEAYGRELPASPAPLAEERFRRLEDRVVELGRPRHMTIYHAPSPEPLVLDVGVPLACHDSSAAQLERVFEQLHQRIEEASHEVRRRQGPNSG